MLFSKIKSPYIISEIGSNHNGNMELCKKLIIQSKNAGVDAVKFQFFSEDGLFSNYYFKKNKINRKDIKKFSLNEKKIKYIFKLCKKIKIDLGFTPLGFSEIDILKKYNIDFFKIASMDCNNYNLIESVAKTRKPLIISTGLSTENEISKAIATAKKYNKNVALLHCVSLYPPKDTEVNLNRLKKLSKYNTIIGFSDHCIGIDQALASIPLGSKIIEKHFTINKKLKGWDHSMSINFKEMVDLVKKTKKIYNSLGSEKIFQTEPKNQIDLFRRSVVAEKNIKEGEYFTLANLGLKRPGNGIPPKMMNKIIGKKAKYNISRGDLLHKNSFF